MASMLLERVYEVPRRVDEKGQHWYRCLSDMHFSSSRIGWAVGSGQILYTANGGKTWINQYRDYIDHTGLSPHRVFAVNSKTCWIIGITSATNIRCCYTVDGGKTWKAKQFENDLYPNDIFFINSKRGWMVSDEGQLLARFGKVHITQDAGISWETNKFELKGKPDRIRFINSRKGWLIKSFPSQDQTKMLSELLTSYDGGLNWHTTKHFDRRISDLYPLSEDRLLLVGDKGFIAKTNDGGKSWKKAITRSHASINAVEFYDNETGIIACDYDTLMLSDDAGENWKKIDKLRTEGNFIGIHFNSETTGILAASCSLYSFKFI